MSTASCMYMAHMVDIIAAGVERQKSRPALHRSRESPFPGRLVLELLPVLMQKWANTLWVNPGTVRAACKACPLAYTYGLPRTCLAYATTTHSWWPIPPLKEGLPPPPGSLGLASLCLSPCLGCGRHHHWHLSILRIGYCNGLDRRGPVEALFLPRQRAVVGTSVVFSAFVGAAVFSQILSS